MTVSPKYKVLADGPLIGNEREWLPDMPKDNLVAAILMSAVEISRLQDELEQIKGALKKTGIDLPDRSAPIDPEERKRLEREVCGPVINKILAELFRPQETWTDIDPRVRDYFDS